MTGLRNRDEGQVTVDKDTFRAALGQWPSGVTVVTTLVDGKWHGMTASSFSSVSAEPPLVSVCLLKGIYTHDLIADSKVFGINILAADQTEVGKVFAGMRPDVDDRFDGVAAHTEQTGVPLFDHALAWLDCRVVHEYDGGDHTIFVGEVLAAATPRIAAPLLYHSRSWGQFADQLPETAIVHETGLVSALAGHPADAPSLTSALAAAGVSSPPVAPTIDARDPQTIAALLEGQTSATARERVLVLHAFDPAAHDAVVEAVGQLAANGVTEVVLDDTSGDANPLIVRQRLADVSVRIRPATTGVRLRDHAGIGMANALAALKSGATVFDTTLGGVDGVVATEDVLYLFDVLQVGHSADRPAVVQVARDLRATLGVPLPSHTHDLDG